MVILFYYDFAKPMPVSFKCCNFSYRPFERPLFFCGTVFSLNFIKTQVMTKYSIAIHGGAGTILKTSMTSEQEQLYRQGLRDAIDKGDAVLKMGGTALDAVEIA